MIREHNNYIWAVCSSHTGYDRTLTEDLVQDTVTALWERHCRSGGNLIRDKSSLSSLIFTIVRNCHANMQRRQPDIVYVDDSSVLDILQEQPDNERLDRLLELCERLPETDYKLVTSYIDGYSVPEIAKLLSVSEGAVRTRMSRLIRKLKEMIK